MSRFDNFNAKELAILWSSLTTLILTNKPLDYLSENNKIIKNLLKEIDDIAHDNPELLQEDNNE